LRILAQKRRRMEEHMRTRRFFPLLLVVALLAATIGLMPSFAAAAPAADDGPTSTSPMPGYTPTRATLPSPAAPATSGDVLVIQRYWPWDSTADVDVLYALGYNVDTIDMVDLWYVDLLDYQMVLIANDQDQEFYDSYVAQRWVFEDYVYAGGVLVFFAAGEGWNGGTLTGQYLPGGAAVDNTYKDNNNTVANYTHPVVTGILSDGVPLVNGDLYSSYCSHGVFYNLPPGTKTVLRNTLGQPTFIQYKFGAGQVIASTNTWEFSYDGGQPFSLKALDDVFLFALLMSAPDSFYLNAAGNGTVAGLPFTGADILRYTRSSRTWQMVFDASDVGVSANVNAFAFLPSGEILLVFKTNVTLPGLGVVTPWDVVRFSPTQLGPNTAGTFAWYFDGSDVGLTVASEKIDALGFHVTDAGSRRLRISTTGAAAVINEFGNPLAGRDEDVMVFIIQTPGANTVGRWKADLFLDGSNIPGLANEDVVGFATDEMTQDVYLNILGSFNLGGGAAVGTGKSIVKLFPAGAAPGGLYPTTVQWLAAGAGFPSTLDGIEVVP
jgi:hypothetical protein